MEKVLIFKNNLNYSLEGTVITKALNFENEQVKDLYIDFHLQGYTDSSLGIAKWKIDLDNRPTRSLVYANAYMTSFVIDIIKYKEEILNSNFAVSKTESGKYKFWWIVGIERLGQQKTTLYQISLLLDPYWTYGIQTIFSHTKEVLIKHAHTREYLPLSGETQSRQLLDVWSNPYINADEGLKFNDSNYLLVDKENLVAPFLPEHPTWSADTILEKINSNYPAWEFKKYFCNNVMDVYYYWQNTAKAPTGIGELDLQCRTNLIPKAYSLLRFASIKYINTNKKGIQKEEPCKFESLTSSQKVDFYYAWPNHTIPESYTFEFFKRLPLDTYFNTEIWWQKVQSSPDVWAHTLSMSPNSGMAKGDEKYKIPSPLLIQDLMQDAQKVELASTRSFINPFATPDMLKLLQAEPVTEFMHYLPKVSMDIYVGQNFYHAHNIDDALVKYVYPLWLFGSKYKRWDDAHTSLSPTDVQFIQNKAFTNTASGLYHCEVNKFNHAIGSLADPNFKEENYYIENNVQSEKFFKDPLVDNTIFKFNHTQVDPIKINLHPYTKYTLYTPGHNKMEIIRQFLNITDQNYVYFKKIAILNPANNFNYIVPYNKNQDGTKHLYGYDNRYNLFLNDLNTFVYPEKSDAYNQFMIANKSQLNQNYTNNILGGALHAVGGTFKSLLGGVTGLGKKDKTSSPFLSGTGITDIFGGAVDIYKGIANYHAQIQDLKRTPGQWESKGQDLLGNNYIKNQFPCIFKFQLMNPFKKIVKKLFIAHGYALGGYYSLHDFLFGTHQRYFFNYVQGLGVQNIIDIPLNLDLKGSIEQAFITGFEVRHIRLKMLKTNGDWKNQYTTNVFNNYELNNLDYELMNTNND